MDNLDETLARCLCGGVGDPTEGGGPTEHGWLLGETIQPVMLARTRGLVEAPGAGRINETG